MDDAKRQKVEEEDVAMSPAAGGGGFSADLLLEIMRKALRDEGVARRDDLVVLESKMDHKLAAATSDWESRFSQLQQKVEGGQLSEKLERSLDVLSEKVGKLEAQMGCSGQSVSACSTGSPSPSWASRAQPRHSVLRGPLPQWSPRMLYLRGWAPYGCPTSHNISREEAAALDLKVRKALGPVADQLESLPPYVCNHQISFRIVDDAILGAHEVKRKLSEAVAGAQISVRGHEVRVVAEQSPQRRHEYTLFAAALEELKGEPELAGRWEADGRSLRVYATKTWQELGKPGPSSWQWSRASFDEANIPLPSFLRDTGATVTDDMDDN